MMRPLFMTALVAALLVSTSTASAVTLVYDPPASGHAIESFRMTSPAGSMIHTAPDASDSAMLTDGDEDSPVFTVGAFTTFDFQTMLNEAASGDVFKLTRFELILGTDISDQPGSPTFTYTDPDDNPHSIGLSWSHDNILKGRLTADIGGGDMFIAGNNGLLTVWGVDMSVVESQTSIKEVIVEGESIPVPEPATMSLLALGGLLLARRRR